MRALLFGYAVAVASALHTRAYDAMAANQLRGRLIPMADARKRRVSAVEPMKLGLAEAARPLSAAHWVRGM